MKTALLVTESTLTDRYQTTVPDPIRKALRLGKREKIRYTIQSDGSVLLSRSDDDDSDPALSGFLSFLAKDIQENPQRVKALTPDLLNQIKSLIDDVEVDLDAPLDDEGE